MLEPYYKQELIEAGCDEAGRGCRAGSVFAAAVILPKDFHHPMLNDSKKLTARQREQLREVVEREAIAWSVATATAEEIDAMNILRASFLAMNRAVAALSVTPEFLLIDGNRFYPSIVDIPFECFVKGDGRLAPIAAASILAKTHRDQYIEELAVQYPEYGWAENKGYPTAKHRKAVEQFGLTPLHRKTFHLKEHQLELF